MMAKHEGWPERNLIVIPKGQRYYPQRKMVIPGHRLGQKADKVLDNGIRNVENHINSTQSARGMYRGLKQRYTKFGFIPGA